MSKYSGHGSYGVFAVGLTPTYVLFDNITNAPEYMAKMQEYTDSGSGGWTQGIAAVKKFALQAECNDDDAAAVDLVGVAPGTPGTLYLRRGSIEQFDVIAGTIFGGVKRAVDNAEGGVPRVTLSWEHGTATLWVPKASLPSALRVQLVAAGRLTA